MNCYALHNIFNAICIYKSKIEFKRDLSSLEPWLDFQIRALAQERNIAQNVLDDVVSL